MARKKSSSNGSVPSGNGGKSGESEWYNIVLDTEDIADVVSLASSEVEFGDAMVGLLESGVNFTVRFEAGENQYKCFVSDSRGGDDSFRFAISARALSPRHAVAAAIVKLKKLVANPTKYAHGGGGLGIG